MLERLQLDSTETRASTDHNTKLVSPKLKAQEPRHGSKRVKKAIKYFKGKDVSPEKIEKALEGEHFTSEEIQIVINNL